MSAMKWLPGALILGLVSVVAASRAGATIHPSATERRAWQSTARDPTLTFRNVRDKEWTLDRTNGRTSVYDELDRIDRYVELRDRHTHRLIRLRDDRADRRREGDTPWRRWVRGAWVIQPLPPEARKLPPRDHRVRLAYFVPGDREPVANYERKIRVIAAIVAELYRTDLRAKGYETDGVRFVTDGEPVVELVRGRHAASYYNNAPAYDAG
jgi:hypothetical protein